VSEHDGITLKSTLREGRTYAEFAEQHVGHEVHVVGPLVDGGCAIAVRVCTTCLIAALLSGQIAFPLHVSHRDDTDPLTAGTEALPSADAIRAEARRAAMEEAARIARASRFVDGPDGTVEGQIARAILAALPPEAVAADAPAAIPEKG